MEFCYHKNKNKQLHTIGELLRNFYLVKQHTRKTATLLSKVIFSPEY